MIEAGERIPESGRTEVSHAKERPHSFVAEGLLRAEPLDDIAPPDEILAKIPRALAVGHGAVPVGRRNGMLTVAVPDPLDLATIDGIARHAGEMIDAIGASPAEIAGAIERIYGMEKPSAASPVESIRESSSPADDEVSAESAPVVGMVNELIAAAVARGASDIHFEPRARGLKVRLRIDGVMVETSVIERRFQPAVLSRLKIMAGISIAERRVPQDGRIQQMLSDRRVDLRVSSLPSLHGESIVLRVLDAGRRNFHPDALGLDAENRAVLDRILALPDGMVLVTGPTGSGKTTTLYGCLNALNSVDRKIITVEEPVEFQFRGMNQVPVRPEIGLTFATALRAMLRQAPNVILIGEIRDRETAEVAVNAALTGHLVFSTLHTNDAPGAVTRLTDLGARPFLVSAVLRAVVAQRLVRRVCENCARPTEPAPHEKVAAGWIQPDVDFSGCRRGIGCPNCEGTGLSGRTAIFEIFLITETVRGLIATGAGAEAIRAQALREGLRSLRADGLRKVLAGETTIEEVFAATAGDPL
ncbi:MAG TPA: GspE/PulE family protein [Candidatus Didemnitutus sp.]|nr:GspE/PulE family protein [Candidatus Didemnitutus sp.]